MGMTDMEREEQAGGHVAVILGTRPEAIKLFPVIAALREEAGLRVTVGGGSAYDLRGHRRVRGRHPCGLACSSTQPGTPVISRAEGCR